MNIVTFQNKTVNILFKFSKNTGASPLLWDPNLHLFYVTPGSISKFNTSLKLITILAIFCGLQLIRTSIFSQECTWSEETLLLALFTASSSFVIASLPHFTVPHELATVLNSFLKTFSNFTRSLATKILFSKEGLSKRKFYERLGLGMIANCILTSCNLTFHCLTHADSAIYPYSLISIAPKRLKENCLFSYTMYILNALFWTRIQVGLVVGTTIYLVQCLCTVFLCFTFIKEFRMKKTYLEQFTKFQTNVNSFIVQYRTLELIFMLFCKFYGVALIPFLLIVTPGIVSINYTLIYYWNNDGMNLSVKAMLISYLVITEGSWIIFLTLGGHFTRSSNLAILSWKGCNAWRRKERLLMKMFARSCKPMQFRSFWLGYRVKRETAGRFVLAVSKGTFRSVLTLGTA